MEVENIANRLNQHKTDIIEILIKNSFSHFRDYFLIRDKFLKNQLDEEFRKEFCKYYSLNGAMGLNDQQKDIFFGLFTAEENKLEVVLRELYRISGYRNRHSLFLSFGTKLLHTINVDLPIYDRNIAYTLGLPKQTYPLHLEGRIKNRLLIYNELKKWFRVLLSNPEICNCLSEVRNELQQKAKPNNWKDKLLSDTKLLDSLLWTLYPISKK